MQFFFALDSIFLTTYYILQIVRFKEDGMLKEAVYFRIAYQIASKIAYGGLKEKTKFSGRSLVGSEYSASPETVRKALSLLQDEGIINSIEKVGNFVSSREKAIAYVQNHGEQNEFAKLQKKYRQLIAERNAIEKEIEKTAALIFDWEKRYTQKPGVMISEFEIEKGSMAENKTIEELLFRNTTGATIISITDGDNIILSPSCKTALKAHMVLSTVSNLCDLDKILALVKKKETS